MCTLISVVKCNRQRSLGQKHFVSVESGNKTKLG